MRLSRTLIAALASSAALGASALAGPVPGVGVGAGAHAGAVVGAPPAGVPPMGVPPVHVPPANVPPLSVPKPQASLVPPARANAKAGARAGAQNSALLQGSVMHGTVTSVSGDNVTLRLSAGGSVQTFAVSPQTALQLASYLKKNIAFRVQNGVLTLVGKGMPPLHGTIESVSGSTAKVQLANGSTQTYTISAQQASWLQTHVGKSVAFWANAGGTIELDRSSHASAMGRKHTRNPSH